MKYLATKFLSISLSAPLILCSLILMGGCGKSNAIKKGSVSGNVQVKGTPLQNGQIVFSSESLGVNQAAVIQPDGTYSLEASMPVGDYRVYFLPPADGDIQPGLANQQPPVALKNVPEKYRSEASTDLTVIVTEGKNTAPIEIQP